MDFMEFVEEVKRSIRDYLPAEYEDVVIRQETKNNETVLTGLLVRKKDQRVAPNVYLEGYYKEYIAGKQFNKVLDDIARCIVEYGNSEACNMPEETYDMSSYEKVKDKIYFRIINAEMNKNILVERPHRLVEDLAVVFYVKVYNGDKQLGSIAIENRWLERWNVDEETLYQAALKNTPEFFPSTFSAVETIVFNSEEGKYGSDELEKLAEQPVFPSNAYVATNDCGLNGAAVILYPNVLNRIEEVFGDVVLIPSSIHEWIIVKAHEFAAELATLEDMGRGVNDTQVSQEDRLSYQVYKPENGMLKRIVVREDEIIAAAE